MFHVIILFALQKRGVFLKKIFHIIFSQEFIFMLFLNAGFYKSVLPLNNYIDLTLLTLLFSVSVAFYHLFKKRVINKSRLISISLFSFFILLISISLFYTPSVNGGFDKYFNFAIIGGWSFLGPLLIFNGLASLEKFLHSYLILGFITALETLRIYLSNLGAFSQVLIFGSDYLAVGRILGYCICIILPAIILKKRNRTFQSILLILFVLALILIGGRAPLISTLIVCFIILIRQINFKYESGIIKYNRNSFIGLLVLFLGGIYFVNSENQIFNQLKIRLAHLLETSGGNSVSGRLSRFDLAFDMIKSNPIIGKGIDSFSHYSGVRENYPHNIFLEVWSEMGVIGILSFISIIFFSLLEFPFKALTVNNKYQYVGWSLIAMFLFSFINTNISGSIQGNRIFFTLCATLIAFSDIYKKR